MENQVQPPQQKSNRGLHAIYLTIIVILGGLCIFLGLQYKDLKTIVSTKEYTIEQVVSQKDDVESDLKELRAQYDALETNDKALNDELQAKKKYIDSLLTQAEKHKGDAYIIAKLKKETTTLRAIMKGYVRTIDSLNTLNNQLVADKQQLSGQLSEEKNRTAQVIDEKEKLKNRIDKAAMLSTLNVRAVGTKSSRGGKKDTETSKASKVDKIKVTFDISDNDLTPPGNKDIYIRIITPDAQELSEAKDDGHQFTFGNTTAYFAGKKTIDYQNQPMSVLVNCPKAKDGELLPGKYMVEIYSEKTMIGQTTLVLE
jgi:hypothetical protein